MIKQKNKLHPILKEANDTLHHFCRLLHPVNTKKSRCLIKLAATTASLVEVAASAAPRKTEEALQDKL